MTVQQLIDVLLPLNPKREVELDDGQPILSVFENKEDPRWLNIYLSSDTEPINPDTCNTFWTYSDVS